MLTTGAITTGVNGGEGLPATTAIAVPGRLVQQAVTGQTGNPVTETLETTTPTVTSVAVSREGDSADLSKAYAVTVTNTTYNYYDNFGNLLSSASYPNLYNGTAVVTAAAQPAVPGVVGATPVNTYVTTIPAPSQVLYCNPGNPATGEYDGQKNCPAMIPEAVLGRN
jgi:hypothetical protein